MLRKLMTVGSAVALSAGMVVAAGPSAQAVPNFQKVQCSTTGPTFCVYVTFDGPWATWNNITDISMRLTNTTKTGHFELIGPTGHLADSITKVYSAGEFTRLSGSRPGEAEQLWCGRFWERTTNGSDYSAQLVCVTA